ncbi:MBL fold metallo-hydrolase [Lysinibacillus antri]|uniref:Ribonuclease Z n=1 Tax=Lysinibacillus antri TaxID=2498145 RepID=A0A432L7W9_9BACI|nr:MBL fold metallo-hydrolase [Lysinibacillus antri]RUL48268.1 ribonuclease Z [Lysinibacillus antri]
MKIYPLGVGGAFTKTNYHNNYIMQLDEKYLLIDAGTTLRNSLSEAGFNYIDIDYVFISHLHFDHVGGLEEMVMQRFWYFENGQHSPIKTTIIVHEKLLSPLKKLLSNGLENQGRTVDDFCNFILLNDGKDFKIGEYTFSVFETTNAHVEGLLSFGFKIIWDAQNLVFTGDIKHMQMVNILRHINEQTVAIFQDVSFTTNGVHSNLQEVLGYYPLNLYEKLYAMHYNDNVEDYMEQIKEAKIQIVRRQEILEF